MEKLDLISYSVIGVFFFDLFIGDLLTKNLDKRGYLKAKRAISLLIIAVSIAYLIVALIRSRHFLDSVVYHSVTGTGIFKIILCWVIFGLLIHTFWKSYLYFLRHDDKTIMTGWYVRRHSEVLKEKQFDLSCQYLMKALALNPDSVIILCFLASLHEHFMNNPEQADRYLEQAGQVLKNTPQPTVHDQAVLECYTGHILLHRGDTQQAINRFQKAYDLDPQSFRKKDIDNALSAAAGKEV